MRNSPIPRHSERRLIDPERWVFYFSHENPTRLVVFVHGFAGRTVDAWQRFPESGETRAWWRASDMLFVGYDSWRDTIPGVAARLRRELPRFFPHLPGELLAIDGASVRVPSTEPYRELLLIGHSLGAVVVRRALCDVALRWMEQRELDADAPRPTLLQAEARLFSPASAGFRTAGLLGLIQATAAWSAINMYLRQASAFTDLQPDSPILHDTRRRTQDLVNRHNADVSALRARIVWANPEDVVIPERYDTDYVDNSIDGTDHKSVCKPRVGYESPWFFVENGEV